MSSLASSSHFCSVPGLVLFRISSPRCSSFGLQERKKHGFLSAIIQQRLLTVTVVQESFNVLFKGARPSLALLLGSSALEPHIVTKAIISGCRQERHLAYEASGNMAPKRRRPRRIDERPAAVRAAKDDDDDHVEGNSENHSEDESDGAHGKEKRREHYEYADHKVWCSKWYRKFEKHEDDVEIEQADGKQKTAGGSVAWGYRDQDWIEKGKIKDGGSTVSSYIIASPDQNPSMLGSKISCGDTIELKNGAFIRVDRISIFPGNAEVTLSGNLFERNMRLMGWLPRPENEVFELWTFQPGENIETATAYVVNASVSTVRRIWDLHMLPPRLPLYNFPPAPVLASAPNTDQATSAASATSRGTLVCSWKYIVACHTRNFIHRTHYNQTAHTQGQYDEKCLVPVGPPTETPIKTTKTKARRKTKTKTKKKIEDSLASFKSSSCASRPLPSYTFGDAFAGCGGMSRGATMAGGFKVKWGFDANKGAITAFNMNFPNARALHQWSHEFVALNAGTGTGSDSETESEFHVDVLHVSPPCQYFSLAHTRDGANDEQNVAALFAIPELIRKTTPRVVTVEQVPHIMKGHPAFFSALVRFFTCFGYSIRWKVINCVDFGVAQRFRRRLFMIGSR